MVSLLLFSWVLVHTGFCLCPPRICFPVLCKFWQLYGGVNGDLLQEGLCHTQACCTQSRCPCGSPLLTCTSSGDTQIQFCLSLCGVPGSWCTQDLFEPSEHLWQEWGLILKVKLPLIPSCWGFSFALGHGVSPHSPFSTVQPPLQCLPSCWGFSDLGHGVSPHGHSSEAQLLLLTLDVGYLLMAAAPDLGHGVSPLSHSPLQWHTGWEATVRTGHGTTDWFQTGKGVHQGCILSPCLFNLYAEFIMRNTGLEEA